MQPITIADITTSGSPQQIATNGRARWIQFSALTHDARIGDSNVGAAHGANVPSETTVVWPPSPDPNEYYTLANVYVYVASGGTVCITYGGT